MPVLPAGTPRHTAPKTHVKFPPAARRGVQILGTESRSTAWPRSAQNGCLQRGRDQFEMSLKGVAERTVLVQSPAYRRPRPASDAAAAAYTCSQGVLCAMVAVNSRCVERNNRTANAVGPRQRLQAGLSKQVQPEHTQMRCVTVGTVRCCEDIPRWTGSVTCARVQLIQVVPWHATCDTVTSRSETLQCDRGFWHSNSLKHIWRVQALVPHRRRCRVHGNARMCTGFDCCCHSNYKVRDLLV